MNDAGGVVLRTTVASAKSSDVTVTIALQLSDVHINSHYSWLFM